MPTGLFVGLLTRWPLLVSGDDHGTIEVWKLDSWKCLKTLQFGGYSVYSATFSPDGALLASGCLNNFNSSDETIELWNVANWQCVQIIEDHSSHIRNFDVAQSFLQTQRGIFTLPSSPADPTCSGTDPERLSARGGFGMNKNEYWITWNSANFLKLPSSYVMSKFAVSESSIGVGCRSGDVIMLRAAFQGSLQKAQ